MKKRFSDHSIYLHKLYAAVITYIILQHIVKYKTHVFIEVCSILSATAGMPELSGRICAI